MKLSIPKFLIKPLQFCNRHSNEILTGISILSAWGGVYCALKEGPKCKKVLDELNAEGASNLKKTGAVIKNMRCTGVLLMINNTATIVNAVRNGNKIESLLTAYQSLTLASDLRKAKEVEILGEEKAKEIDAACIPAIPESTSKYGSFSNKVYETGHGEALFYLNWGTGIWFRNDPAWVKNAGVDAKDRILNNDETVLLSEFISDLGVRLYRQSGDPLTGYGWHPDFYDKYRQEQFLEFEPALDDCGRAFTVVNFVCNPVQISKPNAVRYHM